MLTSVKFRIFGAAVFVMFFCGGVFACGPNFPNRLLIGGDNVVLKAPVVNFHTEIKSIKIPYDPGCKTVYKGKVRYEEFQVNTDVADLAEALKDSGISEKRRQEVVANYRNARQGLVKFKNAIQAWKDNKDVGPKPVFSMPDFDREVPGEFVDYFRGAVFYHRLEKDKAKEAWSRLLRRPQKERHYRSTWAVFMLGRMMHDRGESAIKYYKEVRNLSARGFSDSIGLAAASYGRQAQILRGMGKFDEALELYFVQLSTGDRGAMNSICMVASQCLRTKDPEVFAKLAANKTTRQIFTAYLVSRRFSKQLSTMWAGALTNANVSVADEGARLALAAYRSGEIELARHWLDVSNDDTDMSIWLRAKLFLYDGKIDLAAKVLAGIVPGFPAARNPIRDGYQQQLIDTRVRGELGVLYLARRQYVESLDILISGGYWEDAAYVAERVLTPEELIAYVDMKWPAVKGKIDERILQPWRYGDPNWFTVRIRYLLARRLSRLGMFDKASQYYPSKWQSRLNEYLLALSDGEDTSKSKEFRASKLWKAACITRYEGMELFGTEVAPDWYHYGGHFDREPLHYVRGSDEYARIAYPKRKRDLSGRFENSKVVLVSKDEQKKIQMHTITPELRFHYRYKAVDMAWRAATLMEDQSNETARVLCIAGSWMAKRDQKTADKFYKAMVNRCGSTELGKQADKLRWFPKYKIDKKKLLE